MRPALALTAVLLSMLWACGPGAPEANNPANRPEPDPELAGRSLADPRLHVCDAMTIPAVHLSASLGEPTPTMSAEVEDLSNIDSVREAVQGGPVGDLSIQLFGPVSDVSPEEEARQAIRLVEAVAPLGKVWLFQTWTDGSHHWDEMNQSWDAQAWSDRTDESIYDHQKEVHALLVAELGEENVGLIPGGEAMLAINDAILGAGQDSPYYNVSALIAEFGMGRNLSRPGVYFMGLVDHAAMHGGELPQDLPESPSVTAEYLDPATAEVVLTPTAREMFRRVVGETFNE